MRFYYLLSFLIVWAACKNDDKIGDDGNVTNAPPPPPIISYTILKTYPHDTSSFTEGLEFYKGNLYEGTGLNGHSNLLKIDLPTGKRLEAVKLPTEFGEGITILNDTVYQLTWKEHIVNVYTVKGLKKIKQLTLNMEGWGLTNNGKELIASDGSGNLYFYNPGDFSLLRTQSVTDAGNSTYNINELEYVDGIIYANQYQTSFIFKINPNSGAIVGKIDLTETVNRIKSIAPYADVLNGIAYNPATKKLYVTGKNWPELYEIELSQ